MPGSALSPFSIFGSSLPSKTLSTAGSKNRHFRCHVCVLDGVFERTEAAGGFLIFEGKVSHVERRTEGGFSTGRAIISGIDGNAGQQMRLSFQNEFLAGRIDGEFTVTVPDMITVLDLDTGRPIAAEGLRYGFRVAVIGIPCSPKWRTPAGLGLAGPHSFGYEVDYRPVEESELGRFFGNGLTGAKAARW